MGVKTFKDLDSLTIEQIIQLPFFYRLTRIKPDPKQNDTCEQWEIVFRCNKLIAEGMYELLDEQSEVPYMVRYRLIDFTGASPFCDKPLTNCKPKFKTH